MSTEAEFTYDCGHPSDQHYQDADGEWWCMGDPDWIDDPDRQHDRCRCHGCMAAPESIVDKK